jgi:hypothetical protein
MDSSLTSRSIAGYPIAATIDFQYKSGSYQTHVEIEGITKDTVLTVNDTLCTEVSFIKDSLINVYVNKHGPIIM